MGKSLSGLIVMHPSIPWTDSVLSSSGYKEKERMFYGKCGFGTLALFRTKFKITSMYDQLQKNKMLFLLLIDPYF